MIYLLFHGVPKYQVVSQSLTTDEYQLAGFNQSQGLDISPLQFNYLCFQFGS